MFYSKPWLDGLIVLLIILMFFGPKRLPALGRSLGHGMREFKDAITGKSSPTEAERAELESQTGAAGDRGQDRQAPATAMPAPAPAQRDEAATVSRSAGSASASEPDS